MATNQSNTENHSRAALDADTLIKLTNVKKQYGKKVVLHDINLEIKKGDRIGVIGPNGGGKSTISEIIAGIRKPTSGTVQKKDNLVLGIQFQESRYPIGITVIDMIKYYLETFSIPMKESELTEVMRLYQILGFKNKFISSLSGGQQQRLNILLSLIHNPDIVILDEVSTGLDIEVRNQILGFIKEKVVKENKSLFLVTHMMSEIEELCNKFIYIHRGEIREAGNVEDIIKEYGSVHNYTWEKFNLEKKADLEAEYLVEKKRQADVSERKTKKGRVNKFDKIISSGKIKDKNIPLMTLLIKYYMKGAAVPFFIFLFPIIMIFLMGNAYAIGSSGGLPVHTLIGSFAAMNALGVGLFVIPSTIIEFKTSVLMKRIGATNIKPIFFLISVIGIGMIFVIISIFWTMLWAGIMFGHKYGWHEIALPSNPLDSFIWFIPVLILGMALGLSLASSFKSITTYNAIINVIYIPLSFFNGEFIPLNVLLQSDVLRAITWINPFKYSMYPFTNAWTGNDIVSFGSAEGLRDIGISLVLIVGLTLIPTFKLRWQD